MMSLTQCWYDNDDDDDDDDDDNYDDSDSDHHHHNDCFHRKMLSIRPPGFPPTTGLFKSGNDDNFGSAQVLLELYRIFKSRWFWWWRWWFVGPSLYEMAALTNELDTLAITTKVKEILMAHNVGQKVSIIVSQPACLRFCTNTVRQQF